MLFKFAHRLSLPSSGVEVILFYVIARVSLLGGLSVTLMVAGSCCGFFLAMILGSVIFPMGGLEVRLASIGDALVVAIVF